MRIAQDAIPGQMIPMWFRPIKPGTYEIICGQLCGLGHYSMKGSLVVDTPADYQAWLKERVELSGTKALLHRWNGHRVNRRRVLHRALCHRQARRKRTSRAAGNK